MSISCFNLVQLPTTKNTHYITQTSMYSWASKVCEKYVCSRCGEAWLSLKVCLENTARLLLPHWGLEALNGLRFWPLTQIKVDILCLLGVYFPVEILIFWKAWQWSLLMSQKKNLRNKTQGIWCNNKWEVCNRTSTTKLIQNLLVASQKQAG